MKLKKILNQNNFWLSLMTVMAISLLLPNLSSAGVAAVLGNAVGGILFLILFAPFIFLFEIEMVILPIIAQFNDFTHISGITAGWKILRDVSNMFFIVILLLMSFATILKMQTYGYKELLKNLIIMAILINFSKTIAGLIIDIGQVVMLTFVSAIKDVAAGNLITAFGIDELMKLDTASSGLADGAGDVTSIVLAYFLAGIMILLASVIVMIFIIMLVMRIIMLWILVVVSPIAFLANTFPATKQYFNKWLSALFKEVMIGPVLIFFLWLSLSILKTDMREEFKKAGSSAESANAEAGNQLSNGIGNGSITEAGKWENILRYIISISMLIGALKMTKSFGSMAGSFGSKWGEAAGKKMASVYYKGTSGAGGLKGGASRLAFGTTVDPVTGEAKMSLVNRGLMRVGKYVPGAKQIAMINEGIEDKRVSTKTAYKKKRGENVRDKEAFHAAGMGRYEKNLRDAEQASKKGKLKAMTAEEVRDKTDRARAMGDFATLTKFRDVHAIANTQSDYQDAHDREEALPLHKNLQMAEGKMYTKNKDDEVVLAEKGTEGYAQAQMTARSLLRLSGKEQSQVMASLNKDSLAALTQAIESLSEADLIAEDEQNNVKQYTNVIGYEKDVNGEYKRDTDGNKIREVTQGINEDSLVAKRMALLNKINPEGEAAKQAYGSINAIAEERATQDRGEENVNFKGSRKEEFVAKSATGEEIAKMDANSEVFKDISKYLQFNQISAAQAAGASSSAIAKIVRIQADAALHNQNVAKGLADMRRLLASSLTREYVPKNIILTMEKARGEKLMSHRNNNDDDDEPSNNAAPSPSTTKPEVSPILDKNEKPFIK